MRRARGFWLLGLLSSSCAVGGFSIVDELPGAGGSSSTSGTNDIGGMPSGAAGSVNQGGNGTSGSTSVGGKGGMGGSLGAVGGASGGEPDQGQAGAGEGGAPAMMGPVAPCEQSNGVPPMFCDDFESGFVAVKWAPPAGSMPEPGQGPHGATKLVHLNGAELASSVTDFKLAAGDELTLSFWLKTPGQTPGAVMMSFHDRTAAASEVRLLEVQKELGWSSSGSNFRVPEAPTGAMLLPNEWACVSISFTDTTMVVRYEVQGSGVVNTLTTDSTPTPGIDAMWQNQPPDARQVAGYPAFGGAVNGVPSEIYLDDVRMARDKSSVCGF